MILVAFGTRPEIIKLFPVIDQLNALTLPFKTLFSGQQPDLYEDVKSLISTPDFSFANFFAGDAKHNTLGESFAKISKASEEFFRQNRFDTVIVQGDTTTAWALAQMAFYSSIKVAHVEAGLRTFDLENPYPEELNRTLITQVAYFNFAPTKRAYDNLLRCDAKNVHLVGNTIVDAVNHFKNNLNLASTYSNKVLVTLHRRENHAFMDQIFDGLNAAAVDNPRLEFIFPIHPNPNVMRHRDRINSGNIHIVPPMAYSDLLKLMSQAAFIISDSGGIQEEATCFNKKVIVVREKTERPEVIDCGLGVLSGRAIGKFIEWALIPPPPLKQSPFGDGHAAEKIVDVLSRH
ncbi:MAG TPA: UDP-N-acetylglucosamine 2-epimerase (non-hydrolyzing) [Syntrophales bacterium]|nr:UDP-N-acetylglucosamine 2-epimerase (non-hydrolyzing) [Syntrophales bacterium]